MATLQSGQTISIQLAEGESYTVTPSGTAQVSTRGVSGSELSAPRTLTSAQTFGPYTEAGAISIACLGGTVDYTQAGGAVYQDPTTGALVGVGDLPEWRGLGGRTIADMLPRHHPVLIPDQINIATAHANAQAANINVSVTLVSTSNEFCAQSIRITVAAAVASDATFRIPLPTDLFGRKPRIYTRLHTRIKVSDWSLLTRFYISPAEQAGTSHRYIFPVMETSGVTGEQGQVSGFSSAWNGVWRTIQNEGYRKTAVGSPKSWLTDANLTPTYETDGIVITLRATAAVTIEINRMYSPEWDAGVYTVVGDGAYDTFQSNVIAAFNERKWKCGVSVFKLSGDGQYPDNYRGFPTSAQLRAISEAGHDVVPHISLPNGSYNHGELTIGVANAGSPATDAQIRQAMAAHLARCTQLFGSTPAALQYGQALQNNAKTATADTASLLKPYGLAHGRGPFTDSEFGCDPWHSSMSSNASYRNPESGLDKAIMAGWIPKRGRWGWGYEQAWFSNVTVDDETDRLRRDTYSGYVMELAVRRAAAFGDGVFSYNHYVEAFGVPNRTGSGNPEPSVFNSGLNFWRDHLADLDARHAAGDLVIVSPSQKHLLTYGRDGEIYLRWDGEWVSRATGRIAF